MLSQFYKETQHTDDQAARVIVDSAKWLKYHYKVIVWALWLRLLLYASK